MKALPWLKNQPRPNSNDDLPGSTQDTLDTPSDPLAIIAKTREQAVSYGDELITALSADLRQGERSQLAAIWALLPFYVDVVATADLANKHAHQGMPAPDQKRAPATPEYIISSWFLAECHAYLTSQPHGYERLHLVTGVKTSGTTRTLDHMARVAMAHQSLTGAKADQYALQKALIEMDDWGHSLHALFHSHPSTGALATRPSSTDLATHHRYESAGYPLIGGIFVKDGYVRFFSTTQPFSVTIYGKGVEKVSGESNVYKIQTTPRRSVSDATFAAED